jgi:predicted Abi (CAAX) family protease
MRANWLLAPVLFWCVAVPFGLLSGLLHWQPQFDGFWLSALVIFFIPALFEEVLFRGPLLLVKEQRKVLPIAAILLLLFVLWHPLNTFLFMPEARSLFTDPRFLFVAFGLGMTCTFLMLQSRHLLPAIMFHWLCVLGWKTLLGGQALMEGLV